MSSSAIFCFLDTFVVISEPIHQKKKGEKGVSHKRRNGRNADCLRPI